MPAPSRPMAMKTAGPPASASRTQVRSHGGRIGDAGHHDQQPHRGQHGGALELAARKVGPDPQDVDADDDADRRQHPREVAQDAVGVFRSAPAPDARPRRGRAPATRRRSGASSSTMASSSVSIARKDISTAVIGLPTPVRRCSAATAGASVGAGSGSSSTQAPMPAATAAETMAASTRRRQARPLGRRPAPRSDAGGRRRRSAARRSGRRRSPPRSSRRRPRAAAARPASSSRP